MANRIHWSKSPQVLQDRLRRTQGLPFALDELTSDLSGVSNVINKLLRSGDLIMDGVATRYDETGKHLIQLARYARGRCQKASPFGPLFIQGEFYAG